MTEPEETGPDHAFAIGGAVLGVVGIIFFLGATFGPYFWPAIEIRDWLRNGKPNACITFSPTGKRQCVSVAVAGMCPPIVAGEDGSCRPEFAPG